VALETEAIDEAEDGYDPIEFSETAAPSQPIMASGVPSVEGHTGLSTPAR